MHVNSHAGNIMHDQIRLQFVCGKNVVLWKKSDSFCKKTQLKILCGNLSSNKKKNTIVCIKTTLFVSLTSKFCGEYWEVFAKVSEQFKQY